MPVDSGILIKREREQMDTKRVELPEAHLGAARRRRPGNVTRVELRIPTELAARLYRLADERGQSISRAGADALERGLEGVDEVEA